MPKPVTFDLVKKDAKTHARRGVVHTPHGDIQTPDPRRKWSRPPGEWAVIISRAGQSEPPPRERLYSLPR